MIPRDYVTEWRAQAPWPGDAQVEQDLVISGALVNLYEEELIASTLAFRGGTALHKLHLSKAARYSEDIDLVQTKRGAIGPAIDAIRSALDGWLGKPKRDVGGLGAKLIYRFESEGRPSVPLRLKIEINTREHDPAAVGCEVRPFAVDSRWYAGHTEVRTFELPEILGTKLRALYQRRKGRDLFDLDCALREGRVDPARIVDAFARYMKAEEHAVSRAEFERNLAAKLQDPVFTEDVGPLLGPEVTYHANTAAALVHEHVIARLEGDPWRGADQ